MGKYHKSYIQLTKKKTEQQTQRIQYIHSCPRGIPPLQPILRITPQNPILNNPQWTIPESHTIPLCLIRVELLLLRLLLLCPRW